jgi:hypothetical protein
MKLGYPDMYYEDVVDYLSLELDNNGIFMPWLK